MKLIVDEYTEVVLRSSVQSVIDCCAAFSQQSIDVNISLTAFEMFWKVYDQMMRTTHDGEPNGAKRDVFDMTMRKLLSPFMDSNGDSQLCDKYPLCSNDIDVQRCPHEWRAVAPNLRQGHFPAF